MPDSRSKLILKLLALVCFILIGNYFSQLAIERLDFEITPLNEPVIHKIIMTSMIAYIVLMALPFVPGAEIGLGLMMVLGPKIVPLVYLCTLASLFLSFLVGRFIPERLIIKFFHDLHLQKASSFLVELEGLSSRQRFDLMTQRSPKIFVPFLLKYRYLALLVSINVPGNIVIGGGGGIAMMAGMSRLFNPWLFLITLAIAVSPVPLFMIIFGGSFADWPI